MAYFLWNKPNVDQIYFQFCLGKEIGKTLFYYGCRKQNEDFLYPEELKEYSENGTLSKLRIAFSREQVEKVYVQNLIKEDAAEVWEMLKEGGHIYVCG